MVTEQDASQVRELMAVAERLVREVGPMVRDARALGVDVAGSKSTPTDVVTQMDLAAEERLRELLADLRPHDGILGEEGEDVATTSGVTWVLDPIDGTVNYLYALPVYAVSVAAVTGPVDPATWTVLSAAVTDAVGGTVWTAGRDHGAYRDGLPVRVNDARPLADSLVGTGFGYDPHRRRRQAQIVAELIGHVRDIRRIGVASVDLCLVASGSLDAFYERGLKPWDLAAGGLVAAEAGAVVTGLDGAPAGEAMTVAGPPETAAALAGFLASQGADSGY